MPQTLSVSNTPSKSKTWTEQERRRAARMVDYILDTHAFVVETIDHHGYDPGVLDMRCELNEAYAIIASLLPRVYPDRERVEAWLARNAAAAEDAPFVFPEESDCSGIVTQHQGTAKWWFIRPDGGSSEPVGLYDTREEAEAFQKRYVAGGYL